MSILAYTLAGIGVLLALTGDVIILTQVFRRGWILFITCLTIPFAAWLFALVHIRKLWLPLVLSIGGGFVAFGGVKLSGSDSLMNFLFG